MPVRTKEEMDQKLVSLREVALEIRKSSKELSEKMMKALDSGSIEKIDECSSQLDLLTNQALEIYANIKAIRWCQGSISDVEFATTSGASLLDYNEEDL